MQGKYTITEKFDEIPDLTEISVSINSETNKKEHEKSEKKSSKWIQALLWTIFVLTFIGTVAGIPLAYFFGRGKISEESEVSL